LIFEDDIATCLSVLKKGGIILYPTDTVWGIGCDATNEQAVQKIYALKKRQQDKSMIILLSRESDILQYSNQDYPKVYDYIKDVAKPVTVIYKEAKNLAKNLVNSDGSIAIRIVRDKFCKTLIDLFGKPIVSTSSNISGYPPPAYFRDIDIEIKNGVDYIVQYRQDDTTMARPSTVVTIDEDGKIIILRP